MSDARDPEEPGRDRQPEPAEPPRPAEPASPAEPAEAASAAQRAELPPEDPFGPDPFGNMPAFSDDPFTGAVPPPRARELRNQARGPERRKEVRAPGPGHSASVPGYDTTPPVAPPPLAPPPVVPPAAGPPPSPPAPSPPPPPASAPPPRPPAPPASASPPPPAAATRREGAEPSIDRAVPRPYSPPPPPPTPPMPTTRRAGPPPPLVPPSVPPPSAAEPSFSATSPFSASSSFTAETSFSTTPPPAAAATTPPPAPPAPASAPPPPSAPPQPTHAPIAPPPAPPAPTARTSDEGGGGWRPPTPVLVLVGAVLVAVVVGVFVGRSIGDDDTASPATTTLPDTTTTAPDEGDDPLSGQEIAARFGAAVWEVEADGCGELWSGTAFAIDPNHLVTNHHVVVTDTTPTLISRSGDRIQGRVIGWSERPDLAIIETDELLPQWLQWAPTDELAEGQPLVVLGFPAPEGDFTVTPGTVLSFQVRGSQREAVRSDAAIDRGNSGGPALDTAGRVMGVVTEMAANEGGFQLVPLIFTHDAVSSMVDEILAAPGEPDPDCTWSEWGSEPVPEGWEENPETWTSGAQAYGDHPVLDGLWDRCAGGEMGACDELWWMSPIGSEYEAFGDTCGNRSEVGTWCDPSTAASAG